MTLEFLIFTEKPMLMQCLDCFMLNAKMILEGLSEIMYGQQED